MQQILTDIKDYLQERFGNPFWISVIFAWLLLNWPVTITALFQSSEFNVRYIINYINSNAQTRYIWWPIAFGLIYSIFSGVLKETLEGLAKSCRSFIADKFHQLGFYKSVSLEEHQRQLQTIEKRLIKNEFKQSEFKLLQEEHENTTSELQGLKEDKVRAESLIIEKLTSASNDTRDGKIAFLKGLHELNYCKDLDFNEIPRKNDPNVTGQNIVLSGPFLESTESLSEEETEEKDSSKSGATSSRKKVQRKFLSEQLKKHEQPEINDPNSLKSLLLTLLLFRSPQLYGHSPNPSLIGIDQSTFNTCANTAVKAKFLVNRGNREFSLTPEGVKYIEEALKDPSNNKIALLLEQMEAHINREIYRTLKNKHMPPSELIHHINYHPELSRILSEMQKSGEIENKGGVLFLKRAPENEEA